MPELSARYGAIMLAPRRGPGVCMDCFNLTRGYERCFACKSAAAQLDTVVPISYSVAQEPLHLALAAYKRTVGVPARRLTCELAAVLWRFLSEHEACVARAVGAERFDLVATVPSSDRERDEGHPLREIVGELVAPTRARHERLLVRSKVELAPRRYSVDRYEPTRALDGERVLLIDDTWTTGASAQSAAAALRRAGASTVAAVVIGRHLNREWHENDRRLRGIARPFDWHTCTGCAVGAGGRAPDHDDSCETAERRMPGHAPDAGRLLAGEAA